MGKVILIGAVGAGMVAAVSPQAALTIGIGVVSLIAARILSRRNAPAGW